MRDQATGRATRLAIVALGATVAAVISAPLAAASIPADRAWTAAAPDGEGGDSEGSTADKSGASGDGGGSQDGGGSEKDESSADSKETKKTSKALKEAEEALSGPGSRARHPESSKAAKVRPQVEIEPSSRTVDEDGTARFTAEVTDAEIGRVHWQTASGNGSWSDVDGSGASLSVKAIREIDGQRFRAVLSTPDGSVASKTATLHVRPAEPAAASSPAVPAEAPDPVPIRELALAPNLPAAPAAPLAADTFAASGPGMLLPAGPAGLLPLLPTATGPAVTPPPAEPVASQPVTTPPTSARLEAAAPDAGPQPYGMVADPSVAAGADQTAVGHNFSPGVPVQVTLEPGGVDLGTHPAAADGTVTTTFSTVGLPLGVIRVVWTPLEEAPPSAVRSPARAAEGAAPGTTDGGGPESDVGDSARQPDGRNGTPSAPTPGGADAGSPGSEGSAGSKGSAGLPGSDGAAELTEKDAAGVGE